MAIAEEHFILDLLDITNIAFSTFLETANKRLKPADLQLVAILSSTIEHDNEFKNVFTESDYRDIVSQVMAHHSQWPPLDDHIVEIGELVVMVSLFSAMGKVFQSKPPISFFLLKRLEGAKAGSVDLQVVGTCLKRLYYAALVEERTTVRRRTVDLFLAEPEGENFWPKFCDIIRRSVPHRHAEVVRLDRQTNQIVYVHPQAAGLDELEAVARTAAGAGLGERAKGNKASNPIVIDYSDDPLVRLSQNSSTKPHEKTIYFPISVQIFSDRQRGDQDRLGAYMRVIDPIVRSNYTVLRPLLWEDRFILSFAMELCAVIMNNYLLRDFQRTELARLTHGFSTTLSAIVSGALEVQTGIEEPIRLLAPSVDGPSMRALDSARRVRDRAESIAAWSEEMLHQVLLEHRIRQLYYDPGENIQNIKGLYRDVLGRVFRMMKPLRNKYKSKWIAIPDKLSDRFRHFPTVKGEPILLRGVFRNLLENSVKYADRSREQIEINVEWRRENKFAVITFTDNGMGVSREEQGNLFISGYRAPRAKALGVEGQGLGLAQAKDFMTQMGGNLMFVENKPGASFAIRLEIDGRE